MTDLIIDQPDECIDCGSTEGPDRRARWECGEADLDTWDRCEHCGNLLCDSCSLAGNHICYRMEDITP